MKRSPQVIVFSTVLIDMLGFGIIVPVLPVYAENSLHASVNDIGMLIVIFSVMQTIFTPIFGSISDRIGRKPVILISLAGSAVSYLIFGFAGTVFMLFVSRIVGGICSSSISTAQAYMADITDSDSRTKAMGLIGTAFNAGFVLGPALGGTLSHYWGAAMPGFVATGLCTLNLLFAWIALPESLTPEKRAVMKEQIKQRSGMKEVLHVLRMPTVGILIILFFLITAAWGGLYSTFTLFCVDDFHLDVAYIGYMMGYLGLVSALVQANIGFFTKRFRESYVMVAGAVVMLLGLLLLGMANSVMMIVLGITVLSIGAGLNTPTLLAIMSKAAGEYEQGSTMGINQSMSSLARVFGPWGGILAYESLGHTSPYFAGGIIMAVVSARSVWFAVRPRSQSA